MCVIQLIEKAEAELAELKQQLADIKKGFEEHVSSPITVKHVITLRLLQDVELREIKKILATRSKEVGMVQKKVSGHETELEQKRADRHSILKMCKVRNMTRITPVKVIGWYCI